MEDSSNHCRVFDDGSDADTAAARTRERVHVEHSV
jgi:hypothetical protein